MAHITDANKVEVLTDVTIEEYSSTLSVRMSTNRTGSIAVGIVSPAVVERKIIREWIEKRQADLVESGEDYNGHLSDLLDEIVERDTKAQYTYGEKKGTPMPYIVTFFLDAEVASVLANALGDTALDHESRATIRKVFSPALDTKGF